MRRVCVFCGSSEGRDPAFANAAVALGRALARRGVALVYGGAQVGLMGRVADAVLAEGGHVIGVIPRALMTREVAHARLPDLRVVDSMHERKAMMVELSDGFIALPGGIGTFEELCETLTWAQLGLHDKPCALLDVAGFYAPLLALLDRAVDAGFLRPAHRDMLLVDTDPDALLSRLETYTPPVVRKWIG